jgi:hypothetical protein
MRLNAAFLFLLLVATAATGLVWGDVASARDGALGARVSVLLAAPVALIAITLLGRIIVKVSALRRDGAEA